MFFSVSTFYGYIKQWSDAELPPEFYQAPVDEEEEEVMGEEI